jgi:hypothetical protein
MESESDSDKTPEDFFDIRNPTDFFLQLRRIRVFKVKKKLRFCRPLPHKERCKHGEIGLDYECI